MSTREVVRSLEVGELVSGAFDFQGKRVVYSFRGFSACCELTEDMVSDVVADVSLRCFGEAQKIGGTWGAAGQGTCE